MTLLGSGAQTDEQVYLDTTNGDHERYSHYVTAEDQMNAYINGQPIMALCGKVWVPNRDPKKFSVCPTCKEMYDEMGGVE